MERSGKLKVMAEKMASARLAAAQLKAANPDMTDGQLRILAVRKLAMDAQSANENTP